MGGSSDSCVDVLGVLVQVITAGIAGVDNMQRVGGCPDSRCTKPGFTPGYEFVGEVVRLGPLTTPQGSLTVGDRVASMCTLGAHTTHIVISSAELIHIDTQDDPIKMRLTSQLYDRLGHVQTQRRRTQAR